MISTAAAAAIALLLAVTTQLPLEASGGHSDPRGATAAPPPPGPSARTEAREQGGGVCSAWVCTAWIPPGGDASVVLTKSRANLAKFTSSCEGRPGLNLQGTLLNDGGKHIKDTAEDCCRDCEDLPECNVWVFCEGNCVDFAYHSCWLKRAMPGFFNLDEAPAAWAAPSSKDVPWTSGWFAPEAGLVATTTPITNVPSTSVTPADRDRSILLEWRADSPQLRQLWIDEIAPLSKWNGVTVGGAEGRVVKLELERKKLTGAVPAALGGLDALELLSLSQNQLTSVPASLGNLKALTRLDLSGNQLKEVPADLGRLAALKVLSFRWNQLSSVPPELGNLAALERLKLEFNKLTSVPPALGKLKALKVLDLYSNQLEFVPKHLGGLSSLTWLNLASNQLTMGRDDDGVPPELGALSSLERLYLSNNKLRSVPKSLGNLAALQILILGENQLMSVPPELGRLTALTTRLDLGNNNLRTVPKELGNLKALKRLDLYGNPNLAAKLPEAVQRLSRTRGGVCDIRR